jgi:tetratricopeptide (TPR) repeat protein
MPFRFRSDLESGTAIARRIFALAAALLTVVLAAHAAPLSPKALERYEQMLATNPVEGIPLDRLWDASVEAGQSAQLLARYATRETFAGRLVYGHLLKRIGRREDARVAYESAAQLEPTNALPALALGELHLQNERPRDAAPWLEKALTLLPPDDPRVADIALRVGAAWLASGEVATAVNAWEKTAARAPANLELRWKLVDTYTSNQLAGRAIPHLEYLAAHASPSDRTRAYEQLARVHEGAGRADEAIAALEKGIALTGAGNWVRANLQSQLIRIHQRHQRIDELAEKWRAFAAANPRDAGAWQQLIDLFDRTGDLAGQRAALESLIALTPRNFETRLRYARLLAKMDDAEGAIARYDQLLGEQPTHPDLVFERARLDVLRDAAPNARMRILALLQRKPGDEALQARAVEFFETHHMNDALEERLRETAATGAEEPLIALARFYFSQRRDAEARATLQRIIPRGGTPVAQAAAIQRIAQTLRAQGDVAGAIESLRSAARLAPDNRDVQMLLGELENARGNASAARAALELAFRASRTDAEALEADQKLFDAMRSESSNEATSAEPRAFSIARNEANTTSISTPALQDQLLALTRAAASEGTVAAWLRAARWQLWTRNPRVAQECAQQALTIEANSRAAHEFMVKLALADAQPARAIHHLQELMQIDPAQAPQYRRRIAQIEAQGNRTDEALRIFRELAAADPGSLEALNDVALAEQRAERWNEALVTCRQIYARSPAARKRDAATQLLRVYERLRLPREAAALLLERVDAEPDDKERTTLFHDLLTLCAKNQLLPWLRDEFEKRRKARVDDYFTGLALGRVLKSLGEKEAAFDLLASVCFAAPDPAESLPELVHEAEELRKFEAAARLQEQLIKIVPSARMETFTKLAQLQERNFDIEGAARTWEKITNLFPRQTDALLHAVEFELEWGTGTRARTLLRKVCALEPANVRALSSLADLELEAGASADAEKHFEEILRSAPAERGGSIRFPAWHPEDAGRLQTTYLDTVRLRRGQPSSEAMRALRSFWVDDQPHLKSDGEVRLEAIRQLARLIENRGDKNALTAWIDRWRKGNNPPTETLCALYHAGANTALLDELENLMAAGTGDVPAQAKQAFLWLALQTRQFDRLSKWLRMRQRTAADRDFLLVALGQYLQSQGAPIDPQAIERLFPRGFRLRLWQAAQMFAQRGRFREAVQLGQRVFDGLSTQRAAYGLDLANWYLYLGEVRAARTVLRASIERPGESFDAPMYSALRQYWMLLPTNERAGFAENFLATMPRTVPPLHEAICRAALHGLQGERTAAEHALQRLLDFGAMSHFSDDESGNSASRAWEFILQAGAQLESWHLDHLAMFIWDAALRDPALVRLQTQAQGAQVQTRATEVRTRLTALKISHADPDAREDLVADYRRHLAQDDLMPLAEALETRGAFARGIETSAKIWESEPSNPHALRNLVGACRTGNDPETLERVLRRCVDEGIYRANEAAHRDLALQLTDVLETRGALVEARDLLAAVSAATGNDSKLLLRLGKLQESTQQLLAAARTYRRVLSIEPANAAASMALASLAEAQRDFAGAIAQLEKPGTGDVDLKLAELYVKAGRRDDALSVVDRAVPGNHIAVTLTTANALASSGALREAIILLRNGIRRGKDFRASFPMQVRLIELLPPTTDRNTTVREWRRLREMAGDDRNLLGEYYDLLSAQAPRLACEKEALAELNDDAQGGSGLLPAGAALVEWHFQHQNGSTAEALATRLLRRNDLSEPAAQKIARAAETHNRSGLLIEARARLARLNALDYTRMLAWAQALHAEQRDAEAHAVLEELGWRAALNEEIPGRIAETFVQWNEIAKARTAFAQLVASDPTARDFRAHIHFARLRAAEGEHAEASKIIRKAFRNPANREMDELIAFLEAEGRLDQFEAELSAADVDQPRIIVARRALLKHSLARGDLPRALWLLQNHPVLADSTSLEPVRALAIQTKEFPACADAFARLAAQPTLSRASLDRNLGLLLGAWAESELAAFQTSAAFAHLTRAMELAPDHFPIARRLAELQREQNNVHGAIETLERFVELAPLPAERDTARQLLAALRTRN